MAAKFEYTPPVNPEAPADSLEHRSNYDVDLGTGRVDAERYYSKEFMQKEWDNLWSRVWLIAGPRSDLEEPGDYFRFNVGHESIIVTLNDDNELRAFYNVCSHRGARLLAARNC